MILYHVTKFSLHFCFTVHHFFFYPQKSGFTLVMSLTIVLVCFFSSMFFYFEKFSTLTFAVCLSVTLHLSNMIFSRRSSNNVALLFSGFRYLSATSENGQWDRTITAITRLLCFRHRTCVLSCRSASGFYSNTVLS